MGFKIFLSILLIAAIHHKECNGKAFGGGGGAGIAQINQLRFQLIVAQQQITASLKAANTTIQNSITLKQGLIDQELKESKNKETQAENAATPEGKHCIEEHANILAQKEATSLRICDQEAQLQAVETKTTLLHTLHAQISTVYVLCPFWPPTINQAQCIQDFCEGMSTQITDLVDDINTDITTVLGDAQSCVDAVYQDTHDAIVKADSDLDACLN